MNMALYKKPLGRSITSGCVMFMTILCLTLSVFNYISERNSLYERYQVYISDILHYVDSVIDDEDLKQCIETGQESEKYKETLKFMDHIMNEFSIHYLYAIKPLNRNETGNVMSVLSAEDDYNRYVDTEGNLYLGWISNDEFDAKTVNRFFDIMEQNDIVFFTEKTEWSTDYTGALPLKDASGKSYAILAVDVDVTTMASELLRQALRNVLVILCLGIIYTISFLLWSRRNITEPIQLLENGVVDYAGRSHGQRDVQALKFHAPVIKTDNEVESLSNAITRMTEDMQDYVSEILHAEEKTRTMKQLADEMSELATVDALTGIRNNTAYAREVAKLSEELSKDRSIEFGMGMIDLNFLKYINDNFGHEKGDEALKRLTKIACEVFAHSPVFRIGGDEFALILRNQDLKNHEALEEAFKSRVMDHLAEEPWKNVSAAIGIAVYDPNRDQTADDVLKRADQLMYSMKKNMKAARA